MFFFFWNRSVPEKPILFWGTGENSPFICPLYAPINICIPCALSTTCVPLGQNSGLPVPILKQPQEMLHQDQGPTERCLETFMALSRIHHLLRIIWDMRDPLDWILSSCRQNLIHRTPLAHPMRNHIITCVATFPATPPRPQPTLWDPARWLTDFTEGNPGTLSVMTRTGEYEETNTFLSVFLHYW